MSPTTKHGGAEISRQDDKKGRDGDDAPEAEGIKQAVQNDCGDLLLWPSVNEPQWIGHIHQREKGAHGSESDLL
jgi:hypothetical protein